eukprot:scaffold71201_cov66-Attheya_sp.AAC.1
MSLCMRKLRDGVFEVLEVLSGHDNQNLSAVDKELVTDVVYLYNKHRGDKAEIVVDNERRLCPVIRRRMTELGIMRDLDMGSCADSPSNPQRQEAVNAQITRLREEADEVERVGLVTAHTRALQQTSAVSFSEGDATDEDVEGGDENEDEEPLSSSRKRRRRNHFVLDEADE